MKGEAQARVVLSAVGHMARLGRFTVPRLTKESGLHRDTVRATVRVAEEQGIVAIDGFGDRLGGHGRGAVPVAYRWLGVRP